MFDVFLTYSVFAFLYYFDDFIFDDTRNWEAFFRGL
jgi:hypothetical protein